MAMKIGICDDSPQMREMLISELQGGSYVKDYEIQEFSSALEIIEIKPKLDLLFLDIEMPGMTGMELMRQYPMLFTKTKVVFLTSYTDYFAEGYEVKAYRYLLKPVQERRLKELFQSISQEEILNETLEVSRNTVLIRLAYKDIIYIQAGKNYAEVITFHDRFRCYKTIKELEEIVPEKYFYRTHKSFIINMKHIKEVSLDGRTIIMCNDERVDVTIRHTKKFLQRHTRFILECM